MLIFKTLKGDGGQKFIPNVTIENLEKLAKAVIESRNDFPVDETIRAMTTVPPFGLGYPSENAVSNYYLGARISREEIARVTKAVGSIGVEPENTRIRKIEEDGMRIFEVLQASVEAESESKPVPTEASDENIRLVSGDHTVELGKICLQ